MIEIRKAQERGVTELEWLKSYHTFSFGEYQNSEHMGFRSLRVINEDTVAGGGGFDTHSHRNMEILTWVLEGSLRHKDSIGSESVITSGELQRMTAGSGILHSEFNDSKKKPVRFLQIWILPAEKGLVPEYEQKSFNFDEQAGELVVIASSDSRDGSLRVRQDAVVSAGRFAAEDSFQYTVKPDRGVWIQLVRGLVNMNGMNLLSGDGAAITDEAIIECNFEEPSELLLFDLR